MKEIFENINELIFQYRDITTLPDDISSYSEEELVNMKAKRIGLKRKINRYLDDVDTDILFIKEELRKRKENER